MSDRKNEHLKNQKTILIDERDILLIQLIHEVTNRGDSVEIKRQADGRLKAYSVRKTIIYK